MGPPVPLLAEWWERFVARLIDGVVFGVASMIVSLILFILFVTLFAFSAYRIRVATIDGRPLSQQVLLRRSAAYPGVFALIGVLAGLSWSAGALGTLLAVGLSLADGIPVITDQRLHQALHDRFAGTVVIKAA
jgi:uncharacterized RDD family membrane protein YckC